MKIKITQTLLGCISVVAVTLPLVSATASSSYFPGAIVRENSEQATILAQQNRESQRRIALVIGNSAYEDGGNLRNPINDAEDTIAALEDLGFEVILVLNADLQEMEEAVNQFNLQLRQGGVGLFYYAGHGLQSGGENYLIPVDARLVREQDVRYETLALGKVLGAMEDAGNELNIILLDACRNNPFSRRWRRSIQVNGLAAIQAVGDSLIAYATAPGEFAEDGGGRNGTFTAHLLRHIRTPGLDILQMFKRVQKGVKEETAGKQIPWVSSSVTQDFSFRPMTENSSGNTMATSGAIAPPSSPPTPEPVPSVPQSPELNLISSASPKFSLVRTFEGHEDSFNPIAISPDSRTLVSSSSGHAIELWDLATGRLQASFENSTDHLHSLAIDPDGLTLVSSGEIHDRNSVISGRHIIRVWNLATGQLKFTFNNPQNSIQSVAISPDSRTFVNSSADRAIEVRDLATGKLKATLSGHQQGIQSVAISPDGRTLVSGSEDRTIKVWDLATGKLKATLSGHQQGIQSVAISPDGRTLVSGSSDRTIKIWDLATGRLKATLSGHQSPVVSVAISPDRQTLVSGSYDGTIKVWDLTTGRVKATLSDRQQGIQSVVISPNGRTLVSSGEDRTIKVWEVSN